MATNNRKKSPINVVDVVNPSEVEQRIIDLDEEPNCCNCTYHEYYRKRYGIDGKHLTCEAAEIEYFEDNESNYDYYGYGQFD